MEVPNPIKRTSSSVLCWNSPVQDPVWLGCWGQVPILEHIIVLGQWGHCDLPILEHVADPVAKLEVASRVGSEAQQRLQV